MKNVIYFKLVNSIGGVESWLYYLSQLYNNFIFFYKEGSPEQIERLAKFVEVKKYNNEIIECENFICNYNPDILDNVKAKNYINMVHCDYKRVHFSPNTDNRFNINVAVSNLAKDSFKEITNRECETIYNPIIIKKPKVEKQKDKLHLISATRLTKEKGLTRMQQLAKMLDNAGIDYEWTIYTNKHRVQVGNKVIFKEPKLDIIEDIAKADYLVQLSDCESYCYSVVESLIVGTKVIVTDLPVFKELGLNEKNSIICDLDMKNVNLNLIKKDYDKFTYTPPKSNWGKYLGKGEYNPNEKIKVKAKHRIYLIEEDKHLIKNDIIEVTKQRASVLECKGLIERI